LEEIVVSESLANASGVLSLGGGAIMSEATQKLLAPMKKETILLEVSIAQAAPRVGFNKERPLLAINPRQAWQALMEKRAPIYRQLAGFSISTDSLKPQQVADSIAEYLESQ